jgi:hypothetical protein
LDDASVSHDYPGIFEFDTHGFVSPLLSSATHYWSQRLD